jgi:hypothetical protein
VLAYWRQVLIATFALGGLSSLAYGMGNV